MNTLNGNMFRAADGGWYDLNRGAPGWVQLQASSARFAGNLQPALQGPIFTRDPAVQRADYEAQGGRYQYGYTDSFGR